MNEQEHQRPWWGDYELRPEETAKWEIGPLRFWLSRGTSEWRQAHDWVDAPDESGWELFRSAVLPEEEVKAERFAVSETSSEVHLRPLAADRSVVARPKTPFRVLPGQHARIFMSAPLWVETSVGPGALVLREIPAKRLSDTWFGASTREGELCYALKTNARTSLDELPRAAYRLLTPVVIKNRAKDPLLVERLNLPVPFLSVYASAAGGAWSEEVHMLWTEGGDLTELDVRDGPPAEAQGAVRLSGPRQIAEKGHLFRAFGSLLGLDL